MPTHELLDRGEPSGQGFRMNVEHRESFIRARGSMRSTGSLRVLLLLAGVFTFLPFTERADTNTAAKADLSNDFLRDHRSDIVLIKGKTGSGTGFIFTRSGRKFLASNAHVIAGIKAPTLIPMDRSLLKLKSGGASVAVGHDIVLMELEEGGKGMPLVESFESEVAVNDPIAVYGNTGGGDVVTVTQGKLAGIGPNRIEIDAEIERGNSGSPIVHVPSGKVIGVATYATTDDLLSGEKKIRRFGYRLDTVKQWQPMIWARFYTEADMLEKIQRTTMELKQAFLELNGLNQRVKKTRVYAYDSPVLRNGLDDFYGRLDDAESQPEADRAVDNLLGTLRGVSQSYPILPKPNFTYDYFRRQFAEEESDRAELMKLFVKIFKN